MLLKLAVKILSHYLRKDRDYWHSWQSNIAVCMQDVLKDDLKFLLSNAMQQPIRVLVIFSSC